jgi:DNA-binding transcriptional LysR family regulator
MKDQSLPDFEGLGLLVTVVEQGGFTAAARATGLRKALISRRVRELEERLRTQLLVRTTRTVRLTEEGRRYFEPAQRALRAAREAELAMAAGLDRPVGVLRVTTTAVLAERLLEPVVLRYLEAYPEVTLELDVSSRATDLLREGFDVAIRVGPLPDSSLSARKLGQARTGYFASPGYVKKHGAPAEPRELAQHATVVIGGDSVVEWPFARDGKPLSVPVHPRLLTSSYELAARAAVAGLGIARLPEFYARELLARRALVAVLQDWTPPPLPVHLLTPPGIQPAKTRAFVKRVLEQPGLASVFPPDAPPATRPRATGAPPPAARSGARPGAGR